MKFTLFLASLFLFFACSDGEQNGSEKDTSFLPEANGKRGEILILMANNLWEGPIGEAVVENLTQVDKNGPYLRPESIFSYYYKDPKTLNHMNRLNRNMLKFILDDDSTYAQTLLVQEKDFYARNQTFIIVKDSDPNRLLDFARNKMNLIIDAFNTAEMNDLIRIYEQDPHDRIKELTENKFGISISLPDESEIKSNRDNFVLIKRDRSHSLIGNQSTKTDGGTYWVQQGILMWSTPYISENQMTVETMLRNRDTTLKYNVPSGVEGAYMGTEYDPYYAPKGKIFEFDGHKTVEISGLWIYDGEVFASGGGPFVQWSILNEKKNEIITICGYIYAPKFEKREYIREIRAMLRTIEVMG